MKVIFGNLRQTMFTPSLAITRLRDNLGDLSALFGGIFLISICLFTLAFYRRSPAITIVHHNGLLVGDRTIEPGVIRINPALPSDLSGLTLSGILEMRRHLVSLQPGLSSAYSPTPEIYSAINPKHPWFGMIGFYYFGIGANVDVGPAVASRLLLNPALLVEAEFTGLSIWDDGRLRWNFEIAGLTEVSGKDFPLHPLLRKIEWNAQERRAAAYYSVSKFLEDVSPFIAQPLRLSDASVTLHGLNARDWGYDFLSVSSSDSAGLGGNFDQVVKNEQRFESNELCGVAPGCNYISQAPPALSGFHIEVLPARLGVRMWSTAPGAGLTDPEFSFFIHFD